MPTEAWAFSWLEAWMNEREKIASLQAEIVILKEQLVLAQDAARRWHACFSKSENALRAVAAAQDKDDGFNHTPHTPKETR
jgi:hypothetical protein